MRRSRSPRGATRTVAAAIAAASLVVLAAAPATAADHGGAGQDVTGPPHCSGSAAEDGPGQGQPSDQACASTDPTEPTEPTEPTAPDGGGDPPGTDGPDPADVPPPPLDINDPVDELPTPDDGVAGDDFDEEALNADDVVAPPEDDPEVLGVQESNDDAVSGAARDELPSAGVEGWTTLLAALASLLLGGMLLRHARPRPAAPRRPSRLPLSRLG